MTSWKKYLDSLTPLDYNQKLGITIMILGLGWIMIITSL